MHNNIGNAYRSNKDLNKAREHIEQAKQMMMLMHGDDPVEEMAKVSMSVSNQLINKQIHIAILSSWAVSSMRNHLVTMGAPIHFKNTWSCSRQVVAFQKS